MSATQQSRGSSASDPTSGAVAHAVTHSGAHPPANPADPPAHDSLRRHVDTSSVLLAVPLAAFAAAFAVRAFTPIVDTTLIAVLAAILVSVAGVALGHRWAAIGFLLVPVALVVSPAGRDLSFSLSAVDSSAWRLHAIVSLLLAGISVGSCAIVLLRAPASRHDDRPRPQGVTVGVVGGLLAGVGLIGLVQLVNPVQVFGGDLSDAERDGLAKVALVDFAYAPLDIEIVPDGLTQVLLVNTGDVPHTVTIETGGPIDLDVYVPARREAVLEVDGSLLSDPTVAFFCAIGDHRDLGMVGRLVIVDR